MRIDRQKLKLEKAFKMDTKQSNQSVETTSARAAVVGSPVTYPVMILQSLAAVPHLKRWTHRDEDQRA